MRRPPRPPDVALAATFHDPPGHLAVALGRTLPRLGIFYRAVAVATSPPTAPAVARLLAGAGMHAGTTRMNVRGPLYRLSIRAALASGASRIHYLDLDRVLHWIGRAPRELGAVLRLARKHSLLLLGRTPKAHRSHHVPLWATETLVNRLIAARLGLARPIDLLVPSFVLERDVAARLLARSHARDTRIYGEWAALLVELTDEVAYLECRGLDWETPDRHRRAVGRAGLTAWRWRQETPAEWARRVAMAAEFLAGFYHVVGRAAVQTPAVRRLPPRQVAEPTRDMGLGSGYRAFQRGSRFSTKARGPSAWSSLCSTTSR